MMFADVRLAEVLAVALAVTLPGLVAFPLLSAAQRNAPDGGWASARILGCLLWAWLSWIGPSLGAVPYGAATIATAGAVLVAVALWRAWAGGVKPRPSLRAVVAIELVFWTVFLLGLAVMPFNGEANHRTERFVDIALSTRMELTRSFPPADPWAAGSLLDYYYYYGFVVMDVVRRLSRVDVFRFFNYAVAVNYALFATAIVGAAWSLIGRARHALLMGAAVCLGGNLWIWWYVLSRGRVYPVEWFGAARVIPGTINEFPLFSFVWGDLHPYVLAFPIAAAAIGFLPPLGREIQPLSSPRLGLADVLRTAARRWRDRVGLLFWIGLTLGALFPVNSWDFPPYALLLAGAIFLRAGGVSRQPREWLYAAVVAAIPVALGIALYAPFYLSFGGTQAGRGLAWVSRRSDLLPFLCIWGPHLACFLAVSHAEMSRSARRKLLAAIAALVAANLALEYGARPLLSDWLERPGDRFSSVVGGVLLAGHGWTLMALAWALQLRAVLATARQRAVDPLGWLGVVGMLVVLGVELVFVDDVYDGEMERMNTVFKAYVQGWVLLTLAAAGVLARSFIEGAEAFPRRLRVALAAALVVGWSGFLIFAPATRYRLFRVSVMGRPPTMDVTAGLRSLFPEDEAIVRWIRENTDPDARIVEAPGYAYELSGRIATFTGRPTIIGWQSHVGGWRNQREDVRARAADVERIYRSTTLEEALPILAQYGVDYVVVGAQERRAFPLGGLAKFDRCRPVFRHGDGGVFECG